MRSYRAWYLALNFHLESYRKLEVCTCILPRIITIVPYSWYSTCLQVVPPGRRGEVQMTEADVKKTMEVANRRIIVEQAIRRIKTFKFLQTEVPITRIHCLDDVFKIVSGLCNLRVPLSK